jgi:tetratricopeptide (TPR) repeat protein
MVSVNPEAVLPYAKYQGHLRAGSFEAALSRLIEALWSPNMFGFGFSKEKSRANAEKYLQQNKLPQAISEYEKILKVEPRDLAILNTVGDIYSRLGQNEKAIERFLVVAEAYGSDGSLLKSIAVYKKITKLNPNGLPAMEKLAELYRKQGLVSDARSMLLQAAEAYTRKGQSKETLRLLKQLVIFDPENVQVITRTADLMTQGGQKNEAKEMLSQTAATLVDRHALDPAQKILDRLIALDRTNLRAQELRAQVTFELGDAVKAVELYEAIPDLDSRANALRNLLSAYLKLENLDQAFLICRKLVSVHHDCEGVLKVAARLYKENDTLRALDLYSEFSSDVLTQDKEEVLAHLHGAVSRVRNSPEALQTIYDLALRAGETSMFAETLELLAHASVQSNQFERARDAYKELMHLEPENASHIQGYRQVCARLGPAAATATAAPPSSREEPQTLEEFRRSDEPVLPVQSHPEEVEEQIVNALTEAELCESFSSKTLGITALQSALLAAPEDLRLNRALAILHRQDGDAAGASRCYGTMHRVLENLGEIEAAGYYANLAGSGQTTTWEAKSNDFTASDFDLGATDGSTEEIDLSSEWESVWQDAPVEPSAVPPAPAPLPVASTSNFAENIPELLEEVRFCLSQQIWSEAETAISRLAKACPDHPELPAFRAQLSQGRPSPTPKITPPTRYGPVEVIEVQDDEANQGQPASSLRPMVAPSVPVLPFPVAPPAAPTLSSLAAELDAELGETYVPVSQPRREPPVSASPAIAPPPQPPKPPAQESIPYMAASVEPIAAWMPEEAPVPPLTPSVFGDLLQEFERDLSAPEQDDNDPETHFNLGIAFREMGLLDEAIGELQKVCKMAGKGLNPARAQQAYIWLATCFVEKSVPEASFKWFLRALESAPDEDSRTAVNYELASAYEAAGRKRDALEHFMEVYGTNIDYRDVAARIRDLRAAV